MDRLAVSARFPRDVTGSPALALGTGCSPGNPLCAGAESPKSAPQRASGSPVQPCGLVCEVMACRIGHTGRGLVGLGLFPGGPCVRAFLLPRKSWAAARNRSIPRTADGQYQLVGQHPAVSGADGSSAAQPLIPATGPPGSFQVRVTESWVAMA